MSDRFKTAIADLLTVQALATLEARDAAMEAVMRSYFILKPPAPKKDDGIQWTGAIIPAVITPNISALSTPPPTMIEGARSPYVMGFSLAVLTNPERPRDPRVEVWEGTTFRGTLSINEAIAKLEEVLP